MKTPQYVVRLRDKAGQHTIHEVIVEAPNVRLARNAWRSSFGLHAVNYELVGVKIMEEDDEEDPDI